MAIALGDDLDVNVMMGAEQVDRLYLGRALVWPQHPIDDFAVSDNIVKELRFTWTDNNYPLPNSYDLYEKGIRIYTGIRNGDKLDAEAGTATYHIRALYEAGHGVDSNEAEGTALSGIAPGPITDFEASKDQVFAIQFWWTDATGDPKPTYSLYQNGNPLRSNVVSGHRETMPPGSSTFYVEAINAEGERASNSDTGTALDQPPPPGSVEFTVAGNHNFIVPDRISKITVKMIGGGGGGGVAKQNTSIVQGGGGYAGAERTVDLAVSPGQNLTMTVGVGGKGAGVPNGSHANGNVGFPSGIGGTIANGGNGGNGNGAGGESTGYHGNGAGRDGQLVRKTNVYGTYSGWGGQGSSEGNGGNGFSDTHGDAQKGLRGGGGGGCATVNSTTANSNDGGAGYIRVNWG